MKRIAVFVSGGGTNLQALIDAIESGYIQGGKIEIVFSNKKEAHGLQRAQNHNIPTYSLSVKDFKNAAEFDRAVAHKMNELRIDLVCLAGYMKILTKDFLETFKGRIMNIHPALLPSFGGPGMYGIHVHEAVIDHGVKVTGATVHFVDEGADTGPIIVQKCVHVEENDTPATLQKRVLEYEYQAYKEAVKYYCEDRLEVHGRRVVVKGEK